MLGRAAIRKQELTQMKPALLIALLAAL